MLLINLLLNSLYLIFFCYPIDNFFQIFNNNLLCFQTRTLCEETNLVKLSCFYLRNMWQDFIQTLGIVGTNSNPNLALLINRE